MTTPIWTLYADGTAREIRCAVDDVIEITDEQARTVAWVGPAVSQVEGHC